MLMETAKLSLKDFCQYSALFDLQNILVHEDATSFHYGFVLFETRFPYVLGSSLVVVIKHPNKATQGRTGFFLLIIQGRSRMQSIMAGEEEAGEKM